MAQTPSTPLHESGDENVRRTETYIGGLIQARAKELNLNIGDGGLREITTQIRGRLTPAQINGSASINVGDVSGAIDAELRKQTDAGKPANIYAAGKATDNTGYALPEKPFSLMSNRGGNQFGALNDRSSSDGGNTITPQGLTPIQKDAFNMADKLGLDWAKNNPDLLRLGPSAIKALADVNFKAESFNKLKEVEFAAGDVVTLARFAKKTNRDANDLADHVAHGNKSLATDETGKVNTQVLKNLRDAEMNYMANPESPAAKEGVTKAVAKAAGTDPKKQEEGRKLEEALGTQKKLEKRSELKRDDSTKLRDDAVLDLNAPIVVASATPTDKPKEDKPKEGKPEETNAKAKDSKLASNEKPAADAKAKAGAKPSAPKMG
ncbi:hypothetical protein [Bradyrhizobium sp. CCGUVB14]|uniref:hypothetical protein n=1 Tax=Bradyrhizobium sp. CCGUVB14 TaxID=2949628 RepID=UPI0020B259E6|nr:hypothetical protein [Bradyrhizobium sp. CCGUVB14]MCP3439817.1 hypothetical protein [Bradyrhizobium sp. CCGUVB14]